MSSNAIKLFGLNNISIEAGLQQLGKELDIDIGRSRPGVEKDEKYYMQFPANIRQKATAMAQHYEVFYCLENSIRELISDRLSDEFGPDWWSSQVPQLVRENAEKNRKKEIQSGVTPRSVDYLSYTNFGELGEIIKYNWPIFSDTFTDIRAVEGVLNRLNTLRAPIAHCCPLAEDEILRIHLSVRDWFRLME